MQLTDLLTPDRVQIALRARDKTALLTDLARLAAARLGIEAAPILAALAARERLGSTGFGRGFALPHARVEGVKSLFGLFARLAKPIHFDAIDGTAVDLVFLLLIPPAGTDHVAALAAVAREMRDESKLQKIRAAEDSQTLYNELTK